PSILDSNTMCADAHASCQIASGILRLRNTCRHYVPGNNRHTIHLHRAKASKSQLIYYLQGVQKIFVQSNFKACPSEAVFFQIPRQCNYLFMLYLYKTVQPEG